MRNRWIALVISAAVLVMVLAVAMQPASAYGGVTSGSKQVQSTHGVPNVPHMPGIPHAPSMHWPGHRMPTGSGAMFPVKSA